MTMKRLIFGLCFGGLLILSSCAPNKFFLINSEGILEYNRHTGQLEFMWQTKSASMDSATIVKYNPVMPDSMPSIPRR